MSDIGGRIRSLRKEAGLTQADLGRAIGHIGNTYITRLETGAVKNPTVYTLTALARALDCALNDLLRESEGETAPAPKAQKKAREAA